MPDVWDQAEQSLKKTAPDDVWSKAESRLRTRVNPQLKGYPSKEFLRRERAKIPAERIVGPSRNQPSLVVRLLKDIKDTIADIPKTIAPNPEDLLMFEAPVLRAGEAGFAALKPVAKKAATAGLTALSAQQAYQGVKSGNKAQAVIGAVGTGAGALATAAPALERRAIRMGQEFITDSAFRTPEGKIETGANHPEILKRLGMKGFRSKQSRETEDFGFVTNKGKFVTRQEAHDIAVKTGQKLKEPARPGQIHSNEISQFGDKTRTIGEGRAIEKGQVQEGRQPEHKGVPPGADVPGDKGKVREGEGGQTGRRSSVKPAAEVKGKTQEVTPAKTTGIAHRVNVRREAEGEIGAVPMGKGTSAENLVKQGQAKYQGAEHAEKLLAGARKRGVATSREFGIFRAHEQELAKAADAAHQAVLKNPLDPKAKQALADAIQANTNWLRKVKPLSTETSEQMRAHQGEVDISSGKFSAIATRFNQSLTKPRDMTASEIKTASEHSEKITRLQGEVDRLTSELDKALSTERSRAVRRGTKGIPADPAQLKEHLAARLKNGTFFEGPRTMKSRERGAVQAGRGPIANDVVNAIWNHAKANYIDKGADFGTTIDGVAADLGIDRDLVKEAFATNKSVRKITPEMYGKMSDRRQAINEARQWAESANMGPARKAWKVVTNTPRGIAVFGHGIVGMVTHAGENIARPTTWPTYWRNFRRQIPMWMNKSYHEELMQAMERDPEYNAWRQAKLNIDPNRLYDDYQMYGKFIGRIGSAGNRGMDALKTFRFEMAKNTWNGLSESAKADPETREYVAKVINHISGSGSMGHGEMSRVSGELMFAQSLEASRWARTIGDPLKAVSIVAKGKNATPAERVFATQIAKRAVELAAVYGGALAANDAWNRHSGQEGVNFTDPTKADFLRFKRGGRTLDITGNLLGPVRLLGQMWHAFNPKTPKKELAGQTPLKAAGGAAVQYARGKLSPLYGIAADVLDRQDFIGRPLPFSSKPGTPDKPRYTWPEYIEEHGPIPLAGSIREYYDQLRKNGVDDVKAHAMVTALELFGARVGQSPKKKSTGGGYIVP